MSACPNPYPNSRTSLKIGEPLSTLKWFGFKNLHHLPKTAAMSPTSRSLLKRLLPQTAIRQARKVQTTFQRLSLPTTRRIFENAPQIPAFLEPDNLPILQRHYPILPEYGYGADELERRGYARTKEILNLPGASTAKSFLEIGCWDGMVSHALQLKGKQTTAVDNRAEGFDQRALNAGVRLLQNDATHLQFEDGSFDFVFSYDTFEHVAQPERVLQEAARVTKKGGHVFLEFGPLYYSPFGQHAYRSVTVPYCQVLFSKETLQQFVIQRGLDPIGFSKVNEWSLDQYRELWEMNAHQLRKVEYKEILDLSHMNLIRKYSSCFRNKSTLFDNFIVSSIHVVFQKLP